MKSLKNYCTITGSVFIMAIGIYFFKFPNNFCFGGVTGLAVVIEAISPISASKFTLWINLLLLLVGWIFLGKKFAVKTGYASILLSVLLILFEKAYPMSVPLSNEPTLELIFAITLPAIASALLFNIGASSGGTDILAMLLKKYTKVHIGTALMGIDLAAIMIACIVFDIKTALYSFVGLTLKSYLIDGFIENINMCKAFTIICDDTEMICDFIVHDLKRSATVSEANGAYSNKEKFMIITVLDRGQAVRLRQYIHDNQPSAFMLIYNTSEIVGKGFVTI